MLRAVEAGTGIVVGFKCLKWLQEGSIFLPSKPFHQRSSPNGRRVGQKGNKRW